MTDLEIMQRAKMYLDRLAQGIDPISGQEMPEDTILNQARLARCFSYVSGILQQEALELRMLGQLGYDATTFGNHEFDYRSGGLADMLKLHGRFPHSCGNGT